MTTFAVPAPHRTRIVLSGGIALIITVLCYFYQESAWYHQYFPNPGGDFFWALRSARDLLAGQDPYRYPTSKFAIPYPLTAALIGIPFAELPDQIAAALFFGLSSGLLAFGLTMRQYWPLAVFLTPSFWQSFVSIQFVPLMMAVALLPSLLPLTVIKPQLGIMLALYTPWQRLTLFASLSLILLSLIWLPSWPLRWLSQIGTYNGFIPLLAPAGIALTLALLRWREQRARWFLFLAILPQQRYLYDQLLLWLLPQSQREMLLLSLISWIAYPLALQYGFQYGDRLSVWCMYLPMLGIILLRKEQAQRLTSIGQLSQRIQRRKARLTSQG